MEIIMVVMASVTTLTVLNLTLPKPRHERLEIKRAERQIADNVIHVDFVNKKKKKYVA